MTYRTEAWDFLTAGGALFNHLDYSFATGYEDGSFVVAPGQPGGGSAAFRRQMKTLKEVFDHLDFTAMKPFILNAQCAENGVIPVRMLAKEGEQYLLYLKNPQVDSLKNELKEVSCTFSLHLQEGSYIGEWIEPKTAQRTTISAGQHPGGEKAFTTPVFSEDIALKISKNH